LALGTTSRDVAAIETPLAKHRVLRAQRVRRPPQARTLSALTLGGDQTTNLDPIADDR